MKDLGVRLLLAFMVVWGASCGRQQAVKPNFVLVMADDQGWGDVGYNGHPVLKTPHLDNLAQTGLRFDRFYAAAPVCSPTRASVLTGRHPNRFGCFSWGHTLRPQEITLAEVLREAGYRTGHFGKWHVGSVMEGSPVNPGSSGFDEWFSAPNFFDNSPVLSRRGKAVATSGESSLVVVQNALEFIRKNVQEDQPFLAVVWFGSPHRPHQALEQDRQAYADQSERLQHFYGEITAMDRAVGILRQGIWDLGIRDQTLLWYTSDNGALPEGWTGGFRGHKGSLYEGGLLVPSVVEWPGRIPGARSVVTRCNSSDIYPTLLDIAGAETDPQPVLDGLSLSPLFEGREMGAGRSMGFWAYPSPGISTPSREWMAELLAFQQGELPEMDPWRLRLDAGKIDRFYSEDEVPGHSVWIEGDWKLHRILERPDSAARFELYHLGQDPREERDRFSAEPAVASRMAAALREWQRSVIRSLNGADYP